jgi:hypothetical protein
VVRWPKTPPRSPSPTRGRSALPLRTASWEDAYPVRLDSGELATLRASSQAASARLTDNALAPLAVSTGKVTGATVDQHANCARRQHHTDPHVTGQCVLTLAEDEASALRNVLTEWLG